MPTAQPHRDRGSKAQVTVYVERTRVGATNWSSVKRAGVRWARSSRIRVLYGSAHLNNRYLTSPAARRKTACHELGHAFGLGHRRTGRTCTRDGFTTMYGHPDHTDYLNLRRNYAKG